MPMPEDQSPVQISQVVAELRREMAWEDARTPNWERQIRRDLLAAALQRQQGLLRRRA